MAYRTQFGSLGQYQKGEADAINDDPHNYASANILKWRPGHKTESESQPCGISYVAEVVKAQR